MGPNTFQSLVEKLPPVMRPDRVNAPAGGDLPLAGPSGRPTRERPYIHLEASRFAGGRRDPAAVRGEGRLILIKRCAKEEFRLARSGVLRVAHVQGQRPEIEQRIRTLLGEGEPPAVGRKRVWCHLALTFQQRLRFASPVGANPAYGIGARRYRFKGDM